MRDIKTIEKRIEELNKQKKELVFKQAELLYKKIQGALEEKFSPELALTIISESWQKADHQQKESWQSLASSFRSKRNNNAQQKNKKERTENSKLAAQEMEIPAHD